MLFKACLMCTKARAQSKFLLSDKRGHKRGGDITFKLKVLVKSSNKHWLAMNRSGFQINKEKKVYQKGGEESGEAETGQSPMTSRGRRPCCLNKVGKWFHTIKTEQVKTALQHNHGSVNMQHTQSHVLATNLSNIHVATFLLDPLKVNAVPTNPDCLALPRQPVKKKCCSWCIPL